MAIVRDHDERALEIGERLGERLAHLDVEVVRRLVEQQEVGPLPDDQREREARLLAAREARHLLRDLVAAKVEAAEKIAECLLALFRREAHEVPQRALVQAQLVDLVLREVADTQSLRAMDLARRGREIPDDRLEERGLPRAVRAKEPDRIAREHAPLHAREHGSAAVSDRNVLEAEELARLLRGRLEGEVERRVDMGRCDALELLQ